MFLKIKIILCSQNFQALYPALVILLSTLQKEKHPTVELKADMTLSQSIHFASMHGGASQITARTAASFEESEHGSDTL